MLAPSGVRRDDRRGGRSESAAATSAFAAVSSSVASRPAGTSSVCVQVYALPSNTNGVVRLDGVVAGRELHVCRAVRRGDDLARRRGCGVVADEEPVARDRRDLLIRMDEHHADVEDARRLDGADQRAEHDEQRQDRWARHAGRPRARGPLWLEICGDTETFTSLTSRHDCTFPMSGRVIQTRIQLTDEQARRLRRRAKQQGLSMSAMIRRRLDEGLADAPPFGAP